MILRLTYKMLFAPTSYAKMCGSGGRLFQLWISLYPMLLFTRNPFNIPITQTYLHFTQKKKHNTHYKNTQLHTTNIKDKHSILRSKKWWYTLHQEEKSTSKENIIFNSKSAGEKTTCILPLKCRNKTGLQLFQSVCERRVPVYVYV